METHKKRTWHQGYKLRRVRGNRSGWLKTSGAAITSYSPIDGRPIAKVAQAGAADYEAVITKAQEAFLKWRMTPAPARGAVIRQIADALRAKKKALGSLVSLEMGKIQAEGEGEVQEMIDIADFAVGLSRQLYGLTMASERPRHRMYEQWHPLGPVGVITAFNFPVAVWSWNAFIAAVCGDVIIWKPSSKAPLCGVAVQNIIDPILDEHDLAGVFNLVIGSGAGGGRTADQRPRRVPLISATGSCAMGRKVGRAVAARLGRSLLELGGNNAIIIAEDADLDLALRAVLFGAVGTAGQRCTSTRRIIIHSSIKDRFLASLAKAYGQVKVGNPLEPGVLMGPLIDEKAVEGMMAALKAGPGAGRPDRLRRGARQPARPGRRALCAAHHCGGPARSGRNAPGDLCPHPLRDRLRDPGGGHRYPQRSGPGPVLGHLHQSLRQSETFLSHAGSDCGIANVNIGTSGAEIGGAFGGEKDTGGGREAGSDAWKAYMRRQTNTINYSGEMPLAQGIKFELG